MNTIKKSNVGDYIKAVRTAKGLSADDIARSFHVNRSTVFRWENGDISGIKYPCILAISKFLYVPTRIRKKSLEIGLFSIPCVAKFLQKKEAPSGSALF